MKTRLLFLLVLLFPVCTFAQIFEWATPVFGYHTTLDKDNNIIVVGEFKGTVDFDYGPGDASLTATASQDLFISKFGSNGKFKWAKQLEGKSDARDASIHNVKTDQFGNVFVIGNFTGTIDFDPGVGAFNLDSHTGDVFLVKYNSNGDFQWADQLGGQYYQYGLNLVLDRSGNVYITVAYDSEIYAYPSEQTKKYFLSEGAFGSDVLLAKYDQNGAFVWGKNLKYSLSGTMEMPMAIDKRNNIYLAREYIDNPNLFPDDSSYGSGKGINCLFAAKYAPTGELIWGRNIKCDTTMYWQEDVRDIGVDQNNNLFITGKFNYSLYFESKDSTISLTSNGADDIFIAKLDSNGISIWAKKYGSESEDFADRLRLDSKGNIYIGGIFYQDIVELKLTKIGNSSQNQFLIKLNNDGDLNWSDGFPYPSRINDLLVDPAGQIFTIGKLFDLEHYDFDPSVNAFLVSTLNQSDFLTKFSQSNVSSPGNDLLLNDSIFSNNTDHSLVVNDISSEIKDSCFLNYQQKIDFFYVENYIKVGDTLKTRWLIVQENSFHRLDTYTFSKKRNVAGNTKFSLTINCNSNHQSNTFTTFYNFTPEMISSVPVNTVFENVNIYPNPTSDLIHIRNAAGSSLTICNILGQAVFSKVNIGELESIDISSLLSGVYIVRINLENKVLDQKIIKK